VPTYQYACTACGHQLEAVQSFADEPLSECPVCEGRLRKLFSSVGIVFKGSGFYRTDSRSGGTASEPAKSGEAKSAESKSAESKAPAQAAAPKAESSAAKPAAASSAS
jgi:putative FmdB family regulatory protein